MEYIPVAHPLFLGNEIKYLNDCIETSWVSSGKYVERFEKQFAKFCQVTNASSASSGTTALHLLLLALEIKKGDEVIVPDLTYVSTANVVRYVGATPIFADVDENIWTLDPNKLESKISKRTKAIIVVHLYGHPADMDIINDIAKKHKLLVIEDACQAHGAEYKSKRVGSLSKAGCFSFSGAKTITTGEGGMIVSKDKSLIEKTRVINSNYVSRKRNFFHSDIGYNFRFTNIQAALGLAQLERIDKMLITKIRNAKLYSSFLGDEELIQLPQQKPWAKNVFWLYSIVLKKAGLRDKLRNYLAERNIETRPFFVPMHKLPMYKQLGNFHNSNFLSENGISLPSGLTLTSENIEHVSSTVKKFLKSYGKKSQKV